MYEQIDLTDQQWQIVHRMAIELVKADTDPNEVSKALTYLRAFQNSENIGERFFNYLATLAKNGDKVGQSKKTIDYYRNLQSICDEYLQPYRSRSLEMRQLLGWVVRLIRHYKNTSIEELNIDFSSKLKTDKLFKKSVALPRKVYQIGQIFDANITTK